MAQVPLNTVVAFSYAHISGAATTAVKTTPGVLNSIVINSASSGAVITIYDNTAGSGTVIAVVTLGAAETTPTQPIVYNVKFATALTIVTTGTIDMTVTYR